MSRSALTRHNPHRKNNTPILASQISTTQAQQLTSGYQILPPNYYSYSLPLPGTITGAIQGAISGAMPGVTSGINQLQHQQQQQQQGGGGGVYQVNQTTSSSSDITLNVLPNTNVGGVGQGTIPGMIQNTTQVVGNIPGVTPEALAAYQYYQQVQQQQQVLYHNAQMMAANPLMEEEGSRKEVLPINGNSSNFNINPLLYNNILESDYFRALYQLKTYHEVIDEIYASVRNVEPWQTGTSRTPSTAFCLLVKFFLMRLTRKQMVGLINTDDCPYVRCIGFLYLRYSCPPKDLWSWYEPYLEDPEEFAPFSDQAMILTMGQYLIRLLTEMQYFNTTLPRIPVPIERKYKVLLLMLTNRQERRIKNQKDEERGKFFQGVKVRAIYSDEENEPAWYDAIIDSRDKEAEEASLCGSHKYWVTFPEYGNTTSVDLGDIELLEENQNGGDSSPHKRKSSKSRSRSHSPEKKTEDLLTQVLKQERQESVAVGKHYANRPVSYKSSLSLQLDRYTIRQKSPSRAATSDRDRDRSRDRGERHGRGRSRSRSRDRDRDRDYGRSRDYDRDRDRDRERDRSRGRDRDRERDRHDSTSRTGNSSNTQSSMTSSTGQSKAAMDRLKKLRETYGDASANADL